jgi:hypothetical protein
VFPLANGETVVRERRKLVEDPYSEEETLADWTDPDKIDLEGVAIAPSSSTEPVSDARQQVITQMSIYCAPTDDVLPKDRIRARSGLWSVEGEVADWKNALTGWNPGAEFRIKKVSG